MGKKQTICGQCESVCQYKPKCALPIEPTCTNEGVYINVCNGEKYCKSVYISNRFTRIVNSLYNFSGIVGCVDGYPFAIWNMASGSPFVSYPVPYYLEELDGTVKNNTITLVTQIYDGGNDQLTITTPAFAFAIPITFRTSLCNIHRSIVVV